MLSALLEAVPLVATRWHSVKRGGLVFRVIPGLSPSRVSVVVPLNMVSDLDRFARTYIFGKASAGQPNRVMCV